jgi:hypothetical protein
MRLINMEGVSPKMHRIHVTRGKTHAVNGLTASSQSFCQETFLKRATEYFSFPRQQWKKVQKLGGSRRRQVEW